MLYFISTFISKSYQQQFYNTPIRDARGTSPMTARQPPGEKGAKACTIGNTSPASWIFCTYFPGVLENEVQF